jgi:two-component system chemotaxis response regulator CheY
MGRATHILIVDDDVDFSAALRGVLEDEGCVVRDAGDGKGALGILHKYAPLPQLILLDLMMPIMNGWDFYAEVQKDPSLAAIPIAVLSGVGRMRPFGSMHELHKPIDLPNLMGLLHAIEAPDRPSTSVRLGVA